MNETGAAMLQFAHPAWLWGLMLVPLLGVGGYFQGKGRLRDWKRLGQSGRPPATGAAFMAATSCFLILALAQPRWGRREVDPRPIGNDVVVAIDLSRSMGAEDASPNRLGLAVEAAASLIEALGSESRSNRVALVGFEGRGVLRCPLTENLGAVLDALETLRVGEIEPHGTNLGSALDAALEALGNHGDNERWAGSIVVFSDGEDHAQTWSGRVESLKSRGVIVHAVAIGDADEGHVVPVPSGDDPNAARRSLTYQGATVLSKRRDEDLSALSAATGGAFVRLGIATADLGAIYRTKIEPVALAKQSIRTTRRLPERFGLFLIVAFLLFLAANARPRRGALPFRWLFRWSFVLFLVAAIGASPVSNRASEAVKQGALAYSAGRFEQALAHFKEAGRLDAANPVVQFNEAATLFQLKRFDEAYSLYQVARSKADPALRTKIDFTLGNTALALQDPEAAIAHYQTCIDSTTPGARLDEVRRDALLNKQFVENQSRRTPAMAESPAAMKSQPPPKEPREPKASESSSKPSEDSGKGSGKGAGASPNRSRATGGGAGSGSESRSENLEEQFEQAVDNIKKSRRRRLDDSPRGSPSQDLKDW